MRILFAPDWLLLRQIGNGVLLDGTSGIDPLEYRSSGFSEENFLWLRHPGRLKAANRGHPRPTWVARRREVYAFSDFPTSCDFVTPVGSEQPTGGTRGSSILNCENQSTPAKITMTLLDGCTRLQRDGYQTELMICQRVSEGNN